ncbi:MULTISPECIES: zinc transporter ZntB [unclassified Lentimonas]|uniref:zinc transporter ZntB n=1 Tax=unclassified Lentimonas TaxID=2630993 RepID=UPI001325A50E|nr:MULTISPECIES: zinc transporter ZntB [unclassified Lentimonas]CAA6691800.1 Magnesium and cobalt transport protein CorA [Lentimonas sp. CC19]CAA6694548.1 Magnesium and cobalt transport protein CorA [Lentimonas sp. CC10]CAA7072089.1 Magnesium and cobalt transport protein CorA [Lentimonas sp. CC11]
MTDNNSCILHACQIEANTSTDLTVEEVSASLADENSLTWVHLDVTAEGCRDWLEREVSYLDPILINALTADETRPRLLEMEKGVLLILRGINLNDNAEPEDMISIRLWIDGSRIISLRRRRLKAVLDIRERLSVGRGPNSSGEFVTMLTGRLFERMEQTFSDLDDRLDLLEEEVIDSPTSDKRQCIAEIRKEAILFRRYIAPQKDVITHLRGCEQTWLKLLDKRRLQESLDHVTRYIEDLDVIRERAQVVKDELVNALSDRMNRNMYMLSVIAAIFMPLGFLTGLLGINVGGIPGSENGGAFYIFCGILGLIIALQVVFFKKLKWF